MDKQKTSMTTVNVRVEKIDLFSTLVNVTVKAVLLFIIAIFAIGTAYLIISVDSKLDDLTKLLYIMITEIIYVAIMCKIVLHKNKIVCVDIQMDKNGNIGFKYIGKLIKFNIANEYKKKNASLYYHRGSDITTIHIPNLNKQYKVEIFSGHDLKSEIHSIASKFNIPIKTVQED